MISPSVCWYHLAVTGQPKSIEVKLFRTRVRRHYLQRRSVKVRKSPLDSTSLTPGLSVSQSERSILLQTSRSVKQHQLGNQVQVIDLVIKRRYPPLHLPRSPIAVTSRRGPLSSQDQNPLPLHLLHTSTNLADQLSLTTNFLANIFHLPTILHPPLQHPIHLTAPN
jgi:hypothetical protein